MPSIVTHHIFADELLKNINPAIQKQICSSLELYHIFAQSFDNLFYYNLLSLKPGKKIREKGITYQQYKTDEYFLNMIKNIKQTKKEKDTDCLAYLYGSLTHYLLDSTIHPFVIYHAGFIEKNKKETMKYRGNHEAIEVGIDALLFKEKQKKQLYQASLADKLLPKKTFSPSLKQIMNQTFQDTFQQKNMAFIYQKSLFQGNFILKYFVTDHYGIKKRAYQLFDVIFKKNEKKYQNLSFYIKKEDRNLLNNNHHIWCYPTDKTILSQESFDDLYKKAIQKGIILFEKTDLYLNHQISLQEYKKFLKPLSYASGLDWKLPHNWQYFKD